MGKKEARKNKGAMEYDQLDLQAVRVTIADESTSRWPGKVRAND